MCMETFIPTLTVAGLLSAFAPLASSAVNRLTFAPQTKQLIAAVVSVLFAVIAIVVTDGWNQIPPGLSPAAWWIVLGFMAVGISQLAFSLIWRPTGVADKIALVTSTEKERAAYIDASVVPANEETPRITSMDDYSNVTKEDLDRVPGADHKAGN